MKVIINIPEDYYKAIKEIPLRQCTGDMLLIKIGTPITDNATNGDIIKAIFPNQTISCAIPITDRNGAKFYCTTINGVTDFTADWWNAPYKGVKE